MGRLLIVGGVLLAVVGVVIVLAPNIPFLGRLPGDIRIDNGNVKVFIPLGTMLIISLILTVILNLANRR
ncbi:MAG: DUF2905 domain-containing protein [Chloroflexi bacterium]|nr:MAG: DUF2905 domain-containing protein [Chloroflexota bacterium]